MEKIILSLKNIYKLLMTNDFPIYSESVIGKTERKGLTALGFWQQILIEEFRNGTYGRMIWRNDGKRNRYTSHLCNRSPELRCYAQYAGELAVQIGSDSFLKQIARFGNFLEEKDYRHDVFLYRVKELIRICEMGDSCLNSVITGQIQKSLEENRFSSKYERKEKIFHAAYLLTQLTVYAAAGSDMGSSALDILQTEQFQIEAMWRARNRKHEASSAEFTVLTAHVSFLEDTALPAWRFFGREEELYDLKEAILEGQKRMITGMGGIGKTELLRQLLRWCKEQKVIDRLAVIPCENSLMESMVRSFPNQIWEPEQDLSQRFDSLIRFLRWESGQGKLLIMIDNYTEVGDDENQLRKLAELPCGLLVTSRQTRSEEIPIYHLQIPSVSTGALIFRDNYGKPLQQQDRDVLFGMMKEENLCHPLTLRLIARAAHSRSWSVAELRKQLEKNGNMLAWKEADGMIRMETIYRQLYSIMKIPQACRQLAELYALLPRESYGAEFLQEWFPEIVDTSMEKLLAMLAEGGWLDRDDSGYSMHPLIAQCLRRRNMKEEEMSPYLAVMKEWILRTKMDPSFDPDKVQQICRIMIDMARQVTGAVSRELTLAVLMAIELRGSVRLTEKERQLDLVEKLRKNCVQEDENIRICSSMIFCTEHDAEQIYDVYRIQKKEQTVYEWLFLPFCVKAGQVLCGKDPEHAMEMWKTVLDGECSVSWKVQACYRLAGLCNQNGDEASALAWAERGKEYVLKHDCTIEWKITILSELCNLYSLFGRQKAAEQNLEDILKILKEAVPDTMRADITKDRLTDYLRYDILNDKMPDYITANALSSSAIYELHYGSPETALVNYRELLRIMEMYNGKDQSHYLVLGQTAVILQRLQRYEEALEIYREILEYAIKTEDIYLSILFRNNIAVTLLEMQQPEKALVYLEKAAEQASDRGGIQLAEPLRNRARAYRQIGDTRKEYESLKKAVPLLMECYGQDHPRTQESVGRMQELETVLEAVQLIENISE